MSTRMYSALLFAAAGVFCWSGCRASPAGKLETGVMTRLKHITIGEKTAKNPLPASEDNLRAGKDAFTHYCVACHGLDGQNTGVPFAQRMSPPVPSLASKSVQGYSDGQLKRIIDDGIRLTGMPASKGILNDEEIWSIVLYLRHLPPAGSLGEPPFYTGECSSPSSGAPGSR